MKKLLLFFLPLLAWSQGTVPNCTTTQSFTIAATGAVIPNNFTTAGGPSGCVGWRMAFYISPGSGTVSALSVELDGSATSGGSLTALTPAPGGGAGSGATTNPVITFPQGQGNMCCDFYPFLQVKVNTLTVATGTPILIVKLFGYAGTSAAAVSSGQPPIGVAGGDLSGTYPNPLVQQVNGGVIPAGAACVGTNSSGQLVASDNCGSNLVYYMTNGIVSSGTYTSGGSITGTVGQTCTLSTFNGGGTGATATVALTGLNVIAGGTALVITAAGTQYTSAPTSATLGNGTATCSGTATIATVLNQPPSDISGDYAVQAAPYNPKTTMGFPIATGSGTTNEQSWATPAGQPGLAFLPAGSYYCHLHASRTNGFTGTAGLKCRFDEVNAAGAFIATIGTTAVSANIGLTEAEFVVAFNNPNVYTLASTSSRIVTVLQLVQVTLGATGTLNVFVGGTADTHIQLPASQTQYSIDGVPFCTGFAPLNGQTLQYTTSLSPNPCYTSISGFITVTTAAQLQAAVNIAGAGVFIPPNTTIVLSTGVTIGQSGVTILGGGWGSVIKAADGAGITTQLLTSLASRFTIRDLTLDGNRLNGGTIYTPANLTAGIGIGGASGTVLIEHVQIQNVAFYGIGGFASTSDINNVKVVHSYLHNNGGNSGANESATCIWMEGTASFKFTNVLIDGNTFDSCRPVTDPILIGTASVIEGKGITIVNNASYGGDSPGTGIFAVAGWPSGGAGGDFQNCYNDADAVIANNLIDMSGATLTPGGVEVCGNNVKVIGNTIKQFQQQAIGFEGGMTGGIADGNNMVSTIGSSSVGIVTVCGPVDFPNCPSDIMIASNVIKAHSGVTVTFGGSVHPSNYKIHNNDFTGTVSPIGVSSYLPSYHWQINDNLGFNPVLFPINVSVGASPFTYTSGFTPEHITISGGIVSSIILTVPNVPICAVVTACQFDLPPNTSVTIAYSSSPQVISTSM